MWIPAIILGLAGSLHCIGMCGPIALAVPVGSGGSLHRIAAYAFYHFGRVGAYAGLGFLFGTLGYALHLAGAQQALSIAAGVFMLLFIWAPRLLAGLSHSHAVARWQGRLGKHMARYLKANRPAALLSLGFFNGLLPCGLVYLALAGALASYNAAEGALFMVLFGIGTIPALLGLALVGNSVALPWRHRLSRLVPIFTTAIAMLFILRGLNLNIPYLSPAMPAIVNASAICHP